MPDRGAAGRTSEVTFLFTDVEGSTALWDGYGETMAQAQARHDEVLRGAVAAAGGTVFKSFGDAHYAAFAQPAAALQAALAAQRALAAEPWDLEGTGFPGIRVRMATHCGAAERRAGDFFGLALSLTARLMEAGHGGQVLVSQAASAALAGQLPAGVHLRDLGLHHLRGLRRPERVFQVVAGDLPDVVQVPRTIGMLRDRDRIVVVDPATAGGPGALPPTTDRAVTELLPTMLAVVRGDEPTLVLSPAEARRLLTHAPRDLTEFRLGRVAEWSQPRYRLEERFVALTLLVDQGPGSAERWKAQPQRFQDLGALLAAVPDPVLVLLGAPGSGKSTLLRFLELSEAQAALRGHDEGDRVTCVFPLSRFEGRAGARPDPEHWLAARWAERYPALPPLPTLLAEGRMTLLLDGLNEVPVADESGFRAAVRSWKAFVQHLTADRPGNRVVFTCRTLEYSAPLSSPELPVPQAQIEPLSDEQVAEFVRLYSPIHGDALWRAIARSPHLAVLRSPFFLVTLAEQVEATGDVAQDPAAALTGLVRHALLREVERDHPLFSPEGLLSGRDVRQVTRWAWASPYDLPEDGALVPGLTGLAHGMQSRHAGAGAKEVRLDHARAVALAQATGGERLIAAGAALGVLDEDPATGDVGFNHQLLQEYFAARALAVRPRLEPLRSEWRADAMVPSLRDLVATLPASDRLPTLPGSGWEETTRLAVTMLAQPAGFITGLMDVDLVLAGECAADVAVRGRLTERLLSDLRAALAGRLRDGRADLRARIAAGMALGQLDDPRFERRQGPHGAYLLPPLVGLAGGDYPIGEDVPLETHGESTTVHMPAHRVRLAAFALGQFAVTNGEFACFLAAGGYADERWWDTPAAQAWRRGEGTSEGVRANNRWWRQEFKSSPGSVEKFALETGQPEAFLERWRAWVDMTDKAFEKMLAERWPDRALTEPHFWRLTDRNGPNQPVIGVSWFEARAYCNWLAAQTGRPFRLAREVEREAAARGLAGRAFAWGDAPDPLAANVNETRYRVSTPVGAFPDGDTPEGIADLGGNTMDWTSSLWGPSDDAPTVGRYPYDAADGREDPMAPADIQRVARGGAWYEVAALGRACRRASAHPGFRLYLGFRVALDADG